MLTDTVSDADDDTCADAVSVTKNDGDAEPDDEPDKTPERLGVELVLSDADSENIALAVRSPLPVMIDADAEADDEKLER